MLKYVEVNTYINSIAECAQKIVDRLESNLPLTGFKKSMEAYNTSGSRSN